jgi:hypothetical protein
MKLLPLTQGQFAMVDDWNYEWLNQWKWQAIKAQNTYYATRKKRIGPRNEGKYKCFYMHREIMKTPKGLEVDHKDRNGLNCLESNMRNCTHSQNSINKLTWGVSKYIGVCQFRKKNKAKTHIYFIAQISKDGDRMHLGYFKAEVAAAYAYDAAAKIYHGEFANLNFK